MLINNSSCFFGAAKRSMSKENNVIVIITFFILVCLQNVLFPSEDADFHPSKPAKAGLLSS